MSDLIERLGKLQDSCNKQELGLLDTDYVFELVGRAADEIERLTAENRRLRAEDKRIRPLWSAQEDRNFDLFTALKSIAANTCCVTCQEALKALDEQEQSSDEVADTVADQPRQDCLPGADICSNDWHRLKFVDTDWCPDCAMTVDEVNVALRDRALQEQSSNEN